MRFRICWIHNVYCKRQWITNLATHWNYSKLKKHWCLGHTPRDSELIDIMCGLGSGMFRSVKQKENKPTIIVWDFNILLSIIGRTNRKISKDLNNTIDEFDFIGILRTFHLTMSEYTFFSSAHRKISKIDHILGYKISLKKC